MEGGALLSLTVSSSFEMLLVAFLDDSCQLRGLLGFVLMNRVLILEKKFKYLR